MFYFALITSFLYNFFKENKKITFAVLITFLITFLMFS